MYERVPETITADDMALAVEEENRMRKIARVNSRCSFSCRSL